MDKPTKDKLKVIGHRVRQARLDNGWTLEETEEYGWPSWRHLQKIETGKNITVATILNLCKVLKIKPSDLFKGL
jgi:DNA-binding Xre family transcriptional regulator